jgi:hypothetical protein
MIPLIIKKTSDSPVTTLYLCIFLVTLICGLRLGILIPPRRVFSEWNQGSLTRIINPQIKTGQRNLLIIGIDDLSNPTPDMKSLWLAIYLPWNTFVTLIPLYPGNPEGTPYINEELSNSFSLDTNGEPSTRFVEKLNSFIWWDNYFLFDDLALAEGLHSIGLTAIEYGQPDGDNEIGHISDVNLLISETLSEQVNQIKSICNQISWNSIQNGFENNFKDLDDHFNTDLDLVTLMEGWKFHEISLNQPILCEFPTIDEPGQ